MRRAIFLGICLIGLASCCIHAYTTDWSKRNPPPSGTEVLAIVSRELRLARHDKGLERRCSVPFPNFVDGGAFDWPRKRVLFIEFLRHPNERLWSWQLDRGVLAVLGTGNFQAFTLRNERVLAKVRVTTESCVLRQLQPALTDVGPISCRGSMALDDAGGLWLTDGDGQISYRPTDVAEAQIAGEGYEVTVVGDRLVYFARNQDLVVSPASVPLQPKVVLPAPALWYPADALLPNEDGTVALPFEEWCGMRIGPCPVVRRVALDEPRDPVLLAQGLGIVSVLESYPCPTLPTRNNTSAP